MEHGLDAFLIRASGTEYKSQGFYLIPVSALCLDGFYENTTSMRLYPPVAKVLDAMSSHIAYTTAHYNCFFLTWEDVDNGTFAEDLREMREAFLAPYIEE
jgi:hypothetical protein